MKTDSAQKVVSSAVMVQKQLLLFWQPKVKPVAQVPPLGQFPPPLSKQGPSPRAPALMHSPRSRPGGKFSRQNLAQALLPPLAAHAAPGTDASMPPTSAPLSNRSALRLETVPLQAPWPAHRMTSPHLRRECWSGLLGCCEALDRSWGLLSFLPQRTCLALL